MIIHTYKSAVQIGSFLIQFISFLDDLRLSKPCNWCRSGVSLGLLVKTILEKLCFLLFR